MSDETKHRRPIEVLRAEILASVEAKQLAKTFGVTIEVYADLVLEYVKNPAKEPDLEVIDEEDAEEQGVALTTEAETKKWLEGVQSGEVPVGPKRIADGFSIPKSESAGRIMLGQRPLAETTGRESDGRGEVRAPPTELGSVLKSQLRAELGRAMSSTQGGTGKPKK